jgi:hypothetical protein
VLAGVLGRRVEHREQSIAEAAGEMSGFERELTVLTFERLATGRFGVVTDVVERVTGRPARPLSSLHED